jgi:hypothetical protein
MTASDSDRSNLWKVVEHRLVSHFHAETSLLATEKSLFEETAKEPRGFESRPVFAVYGCGLAPNVAKSL